MKGRERVLKPGGQFLLLVINPDGWIRTAYPFFVHHGYFGGRTNHDRWRARLEAAGLHVVEMGTVPGTLWLLAERPQILSPSSGRGQSTIRSATILHCPPIRTRLSSLVALRLRVSVR